MSRVKSLTEAHRDAKRTNRASPPSSSSTRDDLRAAIEAAKTVKDLKAVLLDNLDLLAGS